MSKVPQLPEGHHAVEPWIISRDTPKLMAFLKRAFGAEEVACMAGEDGRVVHAEARIGDSSVLMFDAHPDWPDTPAFIRLYVEDCDATYARALTAGAVSVTSPATHAFGDRTARVRDPLGNLWWLQTHIEDVDERTMAARSGERRYAEAMRDAEETLVREMSRESGSAP